MKNYMMRYMTRYMMVGSGESPTEARQFARGGAGERGRRSAGT